MCAFLPSASACPEHPDILPRSPALHLSSRPAPPHRSFPTTAPTQPLPRETNTLPPTPSQPSSSCYLLPSRAAVAAMQGRLPLSRAFVPEHREPSRQEIMALKDFVQSAEGRLLVLTGAGISTESGIPDYRSEKVGRYTTSKSRPITYQEFMRSSASRRRYWARSFVGWPWFSQLKPNPAHLALAHWHTQGRLTALVTQNVEGLHSKAGSPDVHELHGRLSLVRCLACHSHLPRQSLQDRMAADNHGWGVAETAEIAPDGDVDLSPALIDSFRLPNCPRCASHLLQPDVVFFGDAVPPKRKARVEQCVRQSSALLAVGTSLQVFSAYRIVLQAAEARLPIAILNIGPTRADSLATLSVSTRASAILPLAFSRVETFCSCTHFQTKEVFP